ncbi:MAG: carboxypeptidase-like regulatory domain-containing protein [Planctomycetota bacterium]|jgi:hypothetical protein
MTRFALVLFLVIAGAGTFVAIQWFMGDSGPDRQTAREKMLEGERERRRGSRDEPETKPRPKNVYAAPLRGFVVDTADRPIEGALVRAEDQSTRTNADGGYGFADAPKTGAVSVSARGFFAASRERGGAETLDFELSRAAVLFGRVVDEAGQPVNGAHVYRIHAEHQLLDPSASHDGADTDPKGDYLFAGITAGTTDLGVKASGYLPLVVQDFAVVGEQEHRKDFVLRRGRSVVLHVEGVPEGLLWVVRASDSRLRDKLLPPGGLRLLAGSFPGRELVDYPAAFGVSPMSGLPAGPVDYLLEIVDSDDYFVAEPGLGKLLDNTDPEVTLKLLPGGLVAPVVRDATTREIVYPKVTRFADSTGPLPVDVHVEDKLFVVPTDPRRHKLRFEMAGYESREVELPVKREGILDLQVELQPLADAASGSLRLTFDPKFEGRVGVVGRGEAGARSFDAKRDKDGHWLIEKIPVGVWDFTILATKMVPVQLSGVRIVAGATQELPVVVYAGGGMELKVVDGDGKLLDKVTLDLRNPDNVRIDIHFVTMVSGDRGFTSINYIPSAATARTDSGLAQGTYTLFAGRQGYDVGKAEFSVAGTDVAEVTVVLEKK